MKAIRVSADNDGETHFEDVDLPTHSVANGTYVRTETLPAAETMFAIQEPGFFADWHPAPTKRIFVMVSGSAEVGVSDGEVRTIKQGDVILFEDVTGKGHTMRVIGDVPRVGMHVSLA